MADYKSINTYPKMNETIKDLLIFQGDNYTLYAAKRIEELEAENDSLKETAKEIEKATAREILKMLIGHTMDDDGWTWEIGEKDVTFIADKYGVTAFDEEDEE